MYKFGTDKIFNSLNKGLQEVLKDEKVINRMNFFCTLNTLSESDDNPQNSIPYCIIEKSKRSKS